MKKIFKKNQLIITGLALMIAAAGYLSYSNTGLKTVSYTHLTLPTKA